MRKMVKKQKSAKKCFAAALTLLLIFTMVFGNVFGTGVPGEVYAGGDFNPYGLCEVYSGKTSNPRITFKDDYFDGNGNMKLEFKAYADKNKMYDLLVADETNKKVYINGNYWKLVDEYSKVSYFIIGGKRLVKCNGQSITINKSEFTENSDLYERYGKGFKTLSISCVEGNRKNQWYQGFWFDGNGENTYSPIGSWKGSGDSQWFEDTSGWYPYSQWMKADKFYKDFNANKYKSDACSAGSASWSSDYMYVESAWFYFDANGYAVKSGWHEIDGSWYYFDNFLYEENCWRDGYYINYDGTQTYSYTGSWKSDASGWWYSDTSGWYVANTQQIIDGETYYFKADGYLATDMWIAPGECGTFSENTSWIHVDSSGIQDKTGYYDEKGKWSEMSWH